MRRRRNLRPNDNPRWLPEEARIAVYYTNALVRGEYPDAEAAARPCRDELQRKVWRGCTATCPITGLPIRPRSQDAISQRIAELALQMGRPSTSAAYSDGEKLVLERFARAVAEGRYLNVPAAIPDCLLALAGLRARQPSLAVTVRSEPAVRGRLFILTRRLASVRRGTEWTAAEDRIIERHARAVVGGTYGVIRAVARQCHAAVVKLANERRARSPHHLKGCSTRTYESVYYRLRMRSCELGRPSYHPHYWTPEEEAIAARHARRHRYFLSTRSPWSLPATANLLADRLRDAGFQRSAKECHEKLRRFIYPKSR